MISILLYLRGLRTYCPHSVFRGKGYYYTLLSTGHFHGNSRCYSHPPAHLSNQIPLLCMGFKSIHSLSTFLYNTRIAHIAESVHACTHVPKSFRTCSSKWSVVHVPKSFRTSSLEWNVVLVPESVRASLEHANFPPKFLGSA